MWAVVKASVQLLVFNRSYGDTVIIINTQQRGPFWPGGGMHTHPSHPPPPGYGPEDPVSVPDGLERTTRTCSHHVAQHHPTGSETPPPYALRGSRFGSEPPSVDDVDVWRYAILRVACQKRLMGWLSEAVRHTFSRWRQEV